MPWGHPGNPANSDVIGFWAAVTKGNYYAHATEGIDRGAIELENQFAEECAAEAVDQQG